MSAVLRDASSEEQSSVLPKNFSYEGNYHQKYYYPKIALNNMERRERFARLGSKKPQDVVTAAVSPAITAVSPDDTRNGEIKLRSSSASLDSEEDFRAPSLSDSDTGYSEDYTVMTGTPPQSPGSDDLSDAASVSTLGGCSDEGALSVDGNEHEDQDVPVISELARKILGTKNKTSKTDGEAVSPDGFAAGVSPKIQLPLDMDESQLADPLPSPIQEIPEWTAPRPPPLDLQSPEGPESGDSDSDKGGLFEDREFDFLKTERPRRSTSLKTYKTPPGTPSRKKGVRFADALGLDLESVRHILNLDSPPKIPDYAVKDLQVGLEEEHKTEGARYLSAIFSQPGARPDFMQRVLRDKVALENCLVDDKSMTVTGTVRVANISYHKHVTIRTTLNNWLTYEDVPATYVAGSHDTMTDRFSFTITVPYYFNVGNRLEFCLKYVSDGEWWDNNYGSNYAIICYAKNVPVSQHQNQSWVHFLSD